MLSSAPRSSSDLDFFSPSRSNKPGASPISTVTVTTRLTRRPFLSQPQSRSSTASSLSARSSPCSDPPCNFSRKRKLYPEASLVSVPSSELPPAVKRLRSATPKQKPRRNSSTSKNSSRDSSRRLSSPEPIYRSDRSRSTSLFRSNDSVAGLSSRQWVTDELGTPGENHLSSETVVKQLMKSYRACELSHLTTIVMLTLPQISQILTIQTTCLSSLTLTLWSNLSIRIMAHWKGLFISSFSS